MLIVRLMRTLRRHVATMSWGALACAIAVHFLVSWAAMLWFGEDKLAAPEIFPYFYATVAFTVGFGDFSPSTTAGRYFAALWLMPGGIALLASMIGKTTSVLSDRWQRGLYGKRAYREMEQHTLLVGWNGHESQRIIDLLLQEACSGEREIVIVDAVLESNPRPEHARFVRLDTLADPTGYARASAATARRIIIDAPTDEQTLAAALAVRAAGAQAHVVAHFDREESATLLKRHHPDVECTTPVQAELIVRASHDIGASRVALEMLSVDAGATQYSLVLPAQASAQGYGRYLSLLRRDFRATLLGYAVPEAPLTAILNADDAAQVPAGATLFYLASRRIDADALLRASAAAEAMPG
jgi:voltage-gated potassium channel